MNKPLLPPEIIQYILAIRSHPYNEHWKAHKRRIAKLYRDYQLTKTHEFLFSRRLDLISFYRNLKGTLEITLEQTGNRTLVIKANRPRYHSSQAIKYYPPVVISYTTPSFLQYELVGSATTYQ
jgi:hypothetical protein